MSLFPPSFLNQENQRYDSLLLTRLPFFLSSSVHVDLHFRLYNRSRSRKYIHPMLFDTARDSAVELFFCSWSRLCCFRASCLSRGCRRRGCGCGLHWILRILYAYAYACAENCAGTRRDKEDMCMRRMTAGRLKERERGEKQRRNPNKRITNVKTKKEWKKQK